MDNNLITIFKKILSKNKKNQYEIKKIINLVVANKYIYEYLQNPKSSLSLSSLHSSIYKHIRDNVSSELFEEISTYLHIIIDEYCSYLESNLILQDFLLKRHILVTKMANKIRKEIENQLSDDEDMNVYNHLDDLSIWLISESKVLNTLTLGFL